MQLFPFYTQLFFHSTSSILYIVEDLYMSLYAFHLGQIISTVLRQVDHDGQHGNAARTPIRDETSETDHTQK